jgi:diguanylate cyclase (GGDEF)-like protein
MSQADALPPLVAPELRKAGAPVEPTQCGEPARAPARAALPAEKPGMPAGDYNALFDAVKERLRSLAAPGPVDLQRAAGPADGGGEAVGAGMLECVEALDRLQAESAHERSARDRLQLELFDARTLLVQTRARLEGTQGDERRARHAAMHDALTALPNRRFFRETLEHALARAQLHCRPLAVLFIDLDDFKPINDSYGHETGDELLRVVAARLRNAVRAEDVVSRLGGDEFACLLADVPSRERLGPVIRKLVEVVASPLMIRGVGITVRPSIGVAICPDDGTTVDVLLRRADTAMYQAKRERSGFAFSHYGDL